MRSRRRPRLTSTNGAKICSVFGNSPTKQLPIPNIIDDYNHFMGGCDIADQLHESYRTLIKSHRTWHCLLRWLLDVSLSNSHISQRTKMPGLCGANGKVGGHKDFRLSVATELMKSGMGVGTFLESANLRGGTNADKNGQQQPSGTAHKRKRPSETLFTADTRLDCSLPHLPAFVEHSKRRACVVCALKSSIKCSSCGALLRVRKQQCFAVYHQLPSDMLATMHRSPADARANSNVR